MALIIGWACYGIILLLERRFNKKKKSKSMNEDDEEKKTLKDKVADWIIKHLSYC